MKRVRMFQIEMEFECVGFYGEGKTGVPGRKICLRIDSINIKSLEFLDTGMSCAILNSAFRQYTRLEEAYLLHLKFASQL